ncbi:cytochrome d ubiquinol oxidase subunit II [Euryhalocaulis caribicus]|uniref:cytochrome d ubiquinol oxidase subunit II n=1 Tax=Euryhalocaulis caribicus TaxID=1161401 RepID=UPI00039B02C1|nr:cytochrome d ubiquinol oxidase subunit II [Euryhalocaulis caribicus]
MMDLPTIWAGLICIALLAYVVLDGFDLGVGILFLTGKDTRERDTMMNTVAPVWDGNETWLVLGGGGLFAAFPLAYSVLLTGFYAPIIAMLLALVLRGVAFEFRFKTERWKHYWSWAFFGGSTMAAFTQGIMVGAFVQGVEVQDNVYAGGWFDWLTPFTILCGLALTAGYAMLGAGWMVIKTDGELHDRMNRWRIPIGVIAIGLLALVSFGTLYQQETVRLRWLTAQDGWWFWIIPAGSAIAGLAFLYTARKGKEVTPFLWTLVLFATGFAGLAASLYPYLIPPDITYREAANYDASLVFMLVGALIMLPIILAYTAFAYWTFRGKVDPDHGYH